MLEGSSALLGRLGLRVLVLTYCPQILLLEVYRVVMIPLALFCSCWGALLLVLFCRLLLGFGCRPMVGCPAFESVGFSFTEMPLTWASNSGLLGLVPDLMVGSAVWR